MFKCINGWTKEKMKQRILERNNGTRCAIDGVCRYRLDDNACVAGCFIPDSKYNKKMEGIQIINIVKEFPTLKTEMPLPRNGMYALQLVHDSWRENKIYSLHDSLFHWIDNEVED